MAEEALRSTSIKANFHRLTRLLMRGGVQLLRETLDSFHSPADLPLRLADRRIQAQLNRARLTKTERDCLYPSPGVYGESNDFDITLIFKLFRTICNLTPPPGLRGWDDLPNDSDHTLVADLVRIKYYRNEIYGHRPAMEISDIDFIRLWEEISEALLRIATNISPAKRDEWEKSIDDLLRKPLTPDEERYIEDLETWYMQDMDLKNEFLKLKQGLREELREELREGLREELRSQRGAFVVIQIDVAGHHQAAGSELTFHEPNLLLPEPEQAAGADDPEPNNPPDIDVWNVILSFKESVHLFFRYLLRKLHLLVRNNEVGSWHITVECSSLQVLEGLWEDYRSGHLNSVAQEMLITLQVLEKLGLTELKLKTFISEDQCQKGKKLLEASSGAEDKSEIQALQATITKAIYEGCIESGAEDISEIQALQATTTKAISEGSIKPAITKIKEIATPLSPRKVSKPDFTFSCQFLGTKGITSEVMCVEAFEVLKKRKAWMALYWAGDWTPYCELCIGRTHVRIKQGGTDIEDYRHTIRRISFVTQDPDDKTVFGYGYPFGYTYELFAFMSEEAEVIIKTLRKYRGPTTNIMTEATRSLDAQDELRECQQQLRYVTRQMTIVRGQLQEKNEETVNLQNQATALRQQLEEKEQEVNELETTLCTAQDELREHQRQLRDVTQQMTIVRGQLQEKDDETANLQNQATALRQRLEEKDQEIIELETTLSIAQDELCEHQRQQSPEWVISRDHIQLTSKFLGRGGWGSVIEGKYCGCSVAVKQIYELILSPHNRKLFEREMDIASRCRHPCLLQFIGATNDEGNPLFVTELMETSLRTLLEQRALSEAEMSFISLDVARALNYLHQKQPSPIIHRDVSSANVLLWRQGEHWRGKVSDYGTANFMQQTMTVAPGAMIYSAPEALTKNQTVKVDVYSFGVLLCEMCIRELPDPIRRDRQVAMVKNKLNRALIRRCLQSEPEARPRIQEIIDELEEPV